MKIRNIALASALVAVSSYAQAELSANIGATSNYVWRGVTQTADDAAVSGGVDYAADGGLYVGGWTSNVADGYEFDLYGGYAGEVGDFGYDVGAIGYLYNRANNFYEIYGSVSFGMFEAGIAYTVDKEDTDGDENDLYYHAGMSTELPGGFGLGLTAGYYDIDGGGSSDYAHGQIDLSKGAGEFGDFTLSLSIAEEESGDDDPIVFVSWNKSF